MKTLISCAGLLLASLLPGPGTEPSPLASLVAFGFVGPAAAQDLTPVAFAGHVIDTYWGNPVVGAVVRLEGTVRSDGSPIWGTTNDEGRFRIPEVPPGRSRVTITRLGYADMAQVVDIQKDQYLEIVVIPKPVVLEGIDVYVDRLESRLASLPFTVTTYDEIAIQSSPTMDVATYLSDQPNLDFVPCFENGGAGVQFRQARDCMRARGTVPKRPRIFLDDAPLFGGVQELASMPTIEMYRIDVIRGCAQIRIYTRHYVENVARNPMALLPIICT